MLFIGCARRVRVFLSVIFWVLFATQISATPYTTTVPATGVALPSQYPEAGGVAIVLTGANGNIYYQFSDPVGAFYGFNNTGNPVAFRGNPFTINNPLTLDCGFSSCATYFGGSIVRADIRFSAYDGDTQPGGFDEDDISLRMNGFTVGSWSGLQSEITSTDGTQSFGFTTGFGNNTFNTAWFETTNAALLNNILTTGQTLSQVYDDDPNDNYWDFRRGPSLPTEDVRTVAPGYEFDKTVVGGGTTFTQVGQVIDYEYEVRNIGSVDIDNITVVDDKIPNVMCPAPPNNFLPETMMGAAQPTSLTCTASYTVTQADVDAGVLTNIAVANGDPEFGELGAVEDTVTLSGPTRTNGMTLDKDANVARFGAVGDVVTYTFTVTNTGNTTLTNVVVNDPLIPSLSCNIPQVLPLSASNSDNTETCTGTYTVTQSDVDNFATNGTELVNNATATGSVPGGGSIQASASEALEGTPTAPMLSIVKTAVQGDFDAVGDILDFRIVVTNQGSVTWPGPPSITDVLTGGASCPSGPVAPGASVTCTASYTVAQNDIDAGNVVNEATASVTLGGNTVTATDDVTVPADVTTGLSIVKQLQAGSPDPFNALGQSLVYEYVLTNTGNVTLSTASVTDNRVGVACPSAPIAPGASITCTSAAYVIDQDDLDSGSVTNTASATADVPVGAGGGTVASPNVDLTVVADQEPSLNMVKTAPNVDPIDFVDGHTITYTYDVTNDGNTTIAGPINVVDDRINGGAPFLCSAGPIVPNAAVQCLATYTVTTADVAAGFVTNNAYATDGTTQSNTDDATIPQSGSPGITIDKTAVTASFDAVSDVLTFGFEVRNTGDVTIVLADSPITINDPGVTLSGCNQPALLYPEGSANTPTSYSCTGTFSGLTQADLDSGSFTNTASASFPYTPPLGGTPSTVSSAPSDATVPADITPGFTFVKSSSDDYANVGDTVTYTFSVTNTSNQTLTQVVITDPLIPGLSCTLTNIGGMATQSCAGNYVVDQDDLDLGQIDNTATATGTTPAGSTLTETDSETVTIDPAAQTQSLTLVKDATQPTFAAVGNVINYRFTVTNTGNLTATNIIIDDPAIGVTCVIPSLAPGASDPSCVGSRPVTQVDIDAGFYTNTATAEADGIAPVSASETVNGPARVADWEFSKTADASFSAVGDTVLFTMRIENTGNVTLTNVVLEDTFFDPDVTCLIGDLAPGAVNNSCTGVHTITQADIDAGEITNMASFAGSGVGGAPVSDTTDVTVPGPVRVASLEVVKAEEDANGGYDLGVAEFYTFEVENTGNVTLTNVQFSDPLTGLSCVLPDLAPGAVTTTCADSTPLRDSYTPLQSDIDAGSLTNIATVTADGPTGVGSANDSDSVSLAGPDQLPLISMVKTATGGANFSAVGDVITYDYVVTNDGNITIDAQISVVDDQTNVTCPLAAIAPNASLTCTANYTVDQADLDAGEVVNLATASVSQPVVPSPTHPSGTADVSSGQETETVAADQLPALSIVKRIQPTTPTTYDSTSDSIIFEFVVTNSGNVTTTAPITISDSAIPSNITCTTAPVAPGDSVICSATWSPDQTDIDAGSFTNMADASTVFDGGTVTTPTPGEATAFAVQRPEMTIVKSFITLTTGGLPPASGSGTFAPGETATYGFEVTNTGNTTIASQIVVNDILTGPVNCGAPGVAPNGVVTCTGTYVITQDDFDLGSVSNTATATDGTTTSDPSGQTIPIGADPAIDLVKVANPAPTASEEGDVITYDFTITNTSPGAGGVRPAVGPVFTIRDDKIGVITCDNGVVLGPDESVTCTAMYTVTQADVDAISGTGADGFVTNNATAETTFGTTLVVSPPAQVTVELVGAPELTVTKVATNTTDPGQDADADDILNFQITVANTGNQTISNVIVTDPMLSGLMCTGGGGDPNNLTIAPTETIVCNGTYVVDQDDLDGQTISNTAGAEGSSPQGVVVNDEGSTTYPVANPAPVLTVEKDFIAGAAPTDYSSVGETVSFAITVTNDGNVTINNIAVTDSIVAGTCTVATLAPGESDSSCTFDYEVTQADVDAGQIVNTATASGDPVTGGTTTGTGDETIDGPLREPAIGLAKVGTGPLADGTFDAPGQTLTYVYTIANLGNVTLTETPVVSDNLISSVVCDAMPASGLAPGDELECTASYVTDQDDVDAGFVTNLADVEMPNEYGGAPLTDDTSATVDGGRTVGLTVAKVASDTSDVMVGDVITYTYTVTNTGTVRLTDVTLDDQHTSASGTAALAIAGSPIAVMQPSEVVTLTATYTVTQGDIDAGVPLTNEVTATSMSPAGTVPPEASDDASVSLEAGDGEMTVIKTLPVTPAVLEPGVDLVFEVTVANTGNVTLTAPVLVDTVTQVGASVPLPGGPVPVYQSGDAGTAGSLDVGETWTYQVTYTLTQSDVDAGGISNSVVATANDPSGDPVEDTSDNGTGTGDDPTVVPITSAGALEVLKTVRTVAAVPMVGDVVVFEVTVENTGNVTLTAPVLDENLSRGDGSVISPDPVAIYESGDVGIAGSLDVGEVWTYRVEHTLTQEDVDGGGLSNSVVATANDPSGVPAEDTSDNGTGDGDDPTTIAVVPDPSLEAVKTVSGAVPAIPQVNDIVQFEVAVENTGNVTLTAPVLTDTLMPNGGSAISPAPVPAYDRGDTDGDGSLSVGETWIYVLNYPISQDDLDAGGLSNSVFVEADDPNGTTVDDTSNNGAGAGSTPTSVTLTQDPQVEAIKTIINTPMVAGDTVIFDIAVQNTGNVTLNSVGIASDTLSRADGTSLSLATGPDFLAADAGSVEGALMAGEIATYRATYVLTQDDIDAGGIANTATATGTAPGGATVTDVSDNGTGDGDDPTVFEIVPDPSLDLLKRIVAGGPTFDAVGDVLSYEFDVTNTGNVTIDAPITVDDPLIDGAGGSVTCPATPLAPDAMFTCTGSYSIIQDDLDRGDVENVATVSGGGATSDPSDVTTLAQQEPAMETVKDAVSITVGGTTYPGTPSERYIVGAVVAYEYTVTNTGNTTITAPISVSDNIIPTVTCPAMPAGGLAPLASMVCTADYTVTPDDVALSSVTNLAQATDGTTTSDLVSETVPADGVPALATEKELISVENAAGDPLAGLEYDAVGDVLTYQFTVTNTGLVSFATPITVEDDRIGTIDCFIPDASNPDLIPGEDITCVASYTVDQDDLDEGEVVNTAFAETIFGAGRIVVSDPVMETANVNAAPMIALDKTAATLPVTAVGQVLTYTLTAENTGNQTLRQIIVTDPLLPNLVCEAVELAPAETLTCVDTYVVTQDDIDAGTLVNTADVAAIDPTGAPIEDEVVLVTDMPDAEPSLNLVKSASIEPFGAAGTTIQYSFAVENTGNVTLTNVVVTDAIVSPVYTCTIPQIAVGATDNVTCLLGYTVTQADVDNGRILNTASVVATDPFGTDVTDEDSLATEGTAATPRLNATKMSSVSGDAVAGSVVTYTLSVVNVGNVTLGVSGILDTMTRMDGTVVTLDAPFEFVGGDSNGDDRLGLTEEWTYTAQYTLTQDDIDAGGISNSVTVTGAAPDGTLVDDETDDGIDSDGNVIDDETEVLFAPAPVLTSVKTVTEIGELAGDEVVFEITVRNDGNVTITDIVLTDTMTDAAGNDVSAGVSAPVLLSTPITAGELAPNEVWTYEVRYTLRQVDINNGGLLNSVLTTGKAPNGDPVVDVSDSGDPADGAGDDDPTGVLIPQAPAMEVTKFADAPVRRGDGLFDITFTLLVENTGNVTLSGLSLIDDVAAFAGPSTIVSVSTPTGGGWDAGGVNSSFDGQGITEALQGGTSLQPGFTGDVVFTVRLDIAGGATQNENEVTANSDQIDGSVSASTPIEPLFDPSIDVTKTVSPSSAIVGDVVTYTISVSNTGLFAESDLTVVDEMPAGLMYLPDTASLDPVVTGNVLRWNGIDLPGGTDLVITLQARVLDGPASLTNRAWVATTDGTVISNIAEAVLQIRPEAVFDCGDVIGRVFHDVNMNGYQDGAYAPRDSGITDQTYDADKFEVAPPDAIGAEPGLPGVRLATVDGDVITTDQYGRYSVPCALLPSAMGSNFVLKLDETSLPSGYRMTSENPRMLRLTPGIMTQMNFGASLADIVEVSLTAAAFNGTEPSPALIAGVDQLVAQMSGAPTVLRIGYYMNGEGRAVARARLDVIEALIEDRWGESGSGRDLTIERVIAEVQ